MDKVKIKNDIIKFLQQDCGVSKKQLSDAKKIFSSGLLDSLDIMKIILFFEKNYSISISPLEVSIDHFDTVDLMVAFVQRRLK